MDGDGEDDEGCWKLIRVWSDLQLTLQLHF